MNLTDKVFLCAFLIMSVVFLLIPSIIEIVRRHNNRIHGDFYRRSGVSRIIIFSVFLIISVWCLRYAVGYYKIIVSEDASLTWLEEVFNSLSHTLQTFSLDEDYTEYILSGREMVKALIGKETVWQFAYGVYASVLNLVAPVAGGAIIFEIIASVFPVFRLIVSFGAIWREKYYFSKLNESSLALARSIRKRKWKRFCRPVLIFADAYIIEGDEYSTELMAEAKQIGAICIRDDISHIFKNKRGVKNYFLIDEDETKNLQALTKLACIRNGVYLKRAEINLFTVEDSYVQIERQINDMLKTELGFSDEELPVIIPINGCRNIISQMLVKIPLYEPLIHRSCGQIEKQKLTVSIVGGGIIGTEMFLSTYWIGQILDCELNINIISKESEEEFWNKIDYLNPEIKRSTIPGDPILLYNHRGAMSPVYCNVNYMQCDVKSSKFIDSMQGKDDGRIVDSDYFFVALGSDADNLSVANTVRKYVGERHISLAAKASKDKPQSPAFTNRAIITYVMYDSELSHTLNRTCKFTNYGNTCDIYMRAVGCLDDIYNYENVFMSDYEEMKRGSYEAYMAARGELSRIKTDRVQRTKDQKKRFDDDYTYWADLSRGLHKCYVLYSMGLINSSVFDAEGIDDAVYIASIRSAFERFERIMSGEIEKNPDDHMTMLHRLAWLEHRRWNAFTRVKGFRQTSDYEMYGEKLVPELRDESGKVISPSKNGVYKQMDLKLHPCLVECGDKGIFASVNINGIVDEDSMFKNKEKEDDFDFLDALSYELHDMELNDFDFKQYDYPTAKGK